MILKSINLSSAWYGFYGSWLCVWKEIEHGAANEWKNVDFFARFRVHLITNKIFLVFSQLSLEAAFHLFQFRFLKSVSTVIGSFSWSSLLDIVENETVPSCAHESIHEVLKSHFKYTSLSVITFQFTNYFERGQNCQTFAGVRLYKRKEVNLKACWRWIRVQCSRQYGIRTKWRTPS